MYCNFGECLSILTGRSRIYMAEIARRSQGEESKTNRACFAGPNNLEYLNSGYFLGSGLPLGSGVEHPQVTHINHQPLNKLCPHC